MPGQGKGRSKSGQGAGHQAKEFAAGSASVTSADQLGSGATLRQRLAQIKDPAELERFAAFGDLSEEQSQAIADRQADMQAEAAEEAEPGEPTGDDAA